jgi:predicted aldo/keto reductase-like oxidoreductase
VRFLGVSSHNRRLFPKLRNNEIFDVYHLRYNAVNRGAEDGIFPYMPEGSRPGIVDFTATAWGKLLNPKRMPPGEKVLTAAECYRFVLSHPAVDVCMSGARTTDQMMQNLRILEQGPMTEEELGRVRRIGDHIYGRRSQKQVGRPV